MYKIHTPFVRQNGENMKKILSLMLALVMIVSVFVFSTITASAAQGEWDVYASRGDYVNEDDPNNRSVPGYEYTKEGLHMISANYENSTPYGIFQTKDKVDIREGVYLKVRIDEGFTHPENPGDAQFTLFLNKSKIDEFEKEGSSINLGLAAQVKVYNVDGYERDGKTYNKGDLRNIQSDYCTNYNYGIKTQQDQATDAYVKEVDENGRIILTYEVKWDEVKGYSVSVNGQELGASMFTNLKKFFDSEDIDGQLYVGFGLFNAKNGGSLECTILEYGHTKDDARTPIGDDSAEPDNKNKEFAEIKSPDTVEPGAPAITMNGNGEASDVLDKMTSSNNATIIVREDNTVNVTTDNATPQIVSTVKYDVSYAINDFPYILVIVKNLCTCNEYLEDNDGDGSPDKICAGREQIRSYICAGDAIVPSETYTVTSNTIYPYLEPYTDDEGNTYAAFAVDCSELVNEKGLSGRFHSIRVDFQKVTTSDGRNSFDILEVSTFRTQDEAMNYFDDMMEALGVSGGEEDTEPPIDTEAPTDEPTEAPTDEPTEEPTETETEKDEVTNAPDNNNGDNKTEEKSGCGSTIGIGAMLVVAIAGVGLTSFRKKED